MLKIIFFTLLSLTLASCGGGGSDNAQQLYACSGMVLPGSNLVGGTCVPIQTTPAPSSAGMCCRQSNYSYNAISQTYSSVGYSYRAVGVSGCTAFDATYKCP